VKQGPFGDLRILDFSRVLSGPFCTALLADLGAEVIKVEPPRGDDYRHIGPFKDGESAYFLLANRGKKSVTLDLKSQTGRELARNLAVHCDVLVENFRPGVATRLGIGYQQLRALHPRLIYASISGFGQEGPLAARPAYDIIAQAMSGIMETTGEPAGPPTLIGESIGDLSAGLYAAWAIAAALYQRERSGCGRRIDVAMLDALISFSPSALAQYLFAGKVPRRVGNRHPVSAPFGVFRTRDGFAAIAVLGDAQFARLGGVIGAPDAGADPRFASDENRTANEPALRELIERWTTAHATREVVERLLDERIAAAPIWNIEQAVESEQVRGRGLLRDVEHPVLGRIRLPCQPVRFSGLEPGAPRPPPRLGEHTRTVLREILNLSDEILNGLEAADVVKPE